MEKGQAKRFILPTVSTVGILAVIFFSLYCCRWGVELYDEPFYLVSGFKWFNEGDLPFKNEVHNGPRQYDLLNYLLVRPWLGFSILNLRHASILIYASLLLVYIALSFRRLGISALLTFGACLLFDYYRLPTWSHNGWVRNLLLLHHSLLLLATCGKFEKGLMFLAGIAMGLAGICHYPVGIAIVLSCILVLWIKGKRPAEKKWIGFYPFFLAILCTWAANAFYLMQPQIFPYWKQALSSVALDYFSAGKISPAKGFLIFKPLATWDFWIFSSLILPIWSGTKYRRAQIFFGIGVLLFLLWRCRSLPYGFAILQMFLAVGFVGTFTLIWKALESRDLLLLWMTLVTVMSAIAMAFASQNGDITLFWVMPLVIIPFVAERSAYPLSGRMSLGLLLGWLTWINVGAINHALTSTYRDARPQNCTARLGTPPFEGIYTNPRRAQLIAALSQLLHKHHKILSVGIPGAFLFPGVHSCTDSAISDARLPPELALNALMKMKRLKDYPSLALLQKENNWNWGFTAIKTESSPQNPLESLAHCASHRILLDLNEFEALEIDRLKIEKCLDKVLASHFKMTGSWQEGVVQEMVATE